MHYMDQRLLNNLFLLILVRIYLPRHFWHFYHLFYFFDPWFLWLWILLLLFVLINILLFLFDKLRVLLGISALIRKCHLLFYRDKERRSLSFFILWLILFFLWGLFFLSCFIFLFCRLFFFYSFFLG